MTLETVMSALAAQGSEATKRLWLKHGAREPFFGVKIADLKVLQKKLKGRHDLAGPLYATGNGDAQYLAGLLADGRQLSGAQLQQWAESAGWSMISGTIVPWVASEHPEGFAYARRWIDDPADHVAVAGWRSLAALATVVPDADLPIKVFGELLDRVARELPAAPDEVRLAMNAFVIAVGTYVAPLGDRAITTARRLGRVEADMGATACKIPDAEAYILKSRRGAPIAPKRRTVRC